MTEQPLVSVVIPTHNRPEWLAVAVGSVIDGAFADLEVVVSNNGDPQDTRRVRRAIADPRIRWVDQDQGLGALGNLLAGMRLARGRYIAILHDDDWWAPGFLAALVPPLERSEEVVLAFADHHIVDRSGEVQAHQSELNSALWGRSELAEGLHQPFYEVAARQSVAITGCVFRRSALDLAALTPDVGAFDDIWMIYLLSRTGGAAYFTPARLMYYRAHDSSYTAAGHLSTHLSAIQFRRAMLEDPEMVPYREVIAPRLARAHVWAGAELLRRGRRDEARSHLAKAMRLTPTVRALAGWTASWVAPASLLSRI
jgi:glycosyltransferase involved in cell wall biosynthesis